MHAILAEFPPRRQRPVPPGRRAQVQVLLGMVRLLLARQRGNLSAVAEEAQRLQTMAETPNAAQSASAMSCARWH